MAARDVDRLVNASRGSRLAITTEKDWVKLAPIWPANATELRYVSQAVDVVDGESVIDAALTQAIAHHQPQTVR